MGETLAEFLGSRDVQCPGCGYNLRGLVRDSCPECGRALSVEALRPGVEHREWRESRMPRDPITTGGLIGSILSLGWPLSVFVLGVAQRDQGAFAPGRLLALGLVCLVQIMLVSVYLGGLARMKDWPRRRKWALATAAWCWGPGAVLGLVVWAVMR